MENLSIFCLTLDPSHEEMIKQLSYIPVGLGDKKFSKDCFTDKNEDSISEKNPFYGEYTFHYWLWKNYLDKINTEWVGFCQYRKFFAKEATNKKNINFEDLKNLLISEIDVKGAKYDCILGDKFYVNNFKFSKIMKNHLKEFLIKPNLFLNKKKRNLKFHFDLFHGKGNLDLAIELLDEDNKSNFKNYMSSNNAFNPHNMFICRTKILKEYYSIVFPWLAKCEQIFGFRNQENYGQKRIYGFLAERFLSFWFSKNFKIKEFPIIGKNLSDYKNL